MTCPWGPPKVSNDPCTHHPTQPHTNAETDLETGQLKKCSAGCQRVHFSACSQGRQVAGRRLTGWFLARAASPRREPLGETSVLPAQNGLHRALSERVPGGGSGCRCDVTVSTLLCTDLDTPLRGSACPPAGPVLRVARAAGPAKCLATGRCPPR